MSLVILSAKPLLLDRVRLPDVTIRPPRTGNTSLSLLAVLYFYGFTTYAFNMADLEKVLGTNMVWPPIVFGALALLWRRSPEAPEVIFDGSEPVIQTLDLKATGYLRIPLDIPQEDVQNVARALGMGHLAAAIGVPSYPGGSSLFQAVEKFGRRLDSRSKS